MEVPLTSLGVRQAEGARDALAARDLAAVLSSDQTRALRTATIVAAPHALTVTSDRRLREVHLGAMEGRLASELVAETPPAGVHVSEVRWGGGESLADVAGRLRGLLTDLRALFGADDEVALVSHADTLRVLVTLLDGGTHRDVDWEAWATWGNARVVRRTFS